MAIGGTTVRATALGLALALAGPVAGQEPKEVGIAQLVALARDGTNGQKEQAAGALWDVADPTFYDCFVLGVDIDSNRVAIAKVGGIAPLVALGLSAHFGMAYVSFYLLSGAVGSLAALSLNRALEGRDD